MPFAAATVRQASGVAGRGRQIATWASGGERHPFKSLIGLSTEASWRRSHLQRLAAPSEMAFLDYPQPLPRVPMRRSTPKNLQRVSMKWNTPKLTTGAECREPRDKKAGEPSLAEGFTGLGGAAWHCKAR
jgi:hypothetical protein